MIKVYTKLQCPYCEMTKDYLMRQAIVFEDADALAFIKEQGHRTVPQIYNDNTILVEGGWSGLQALGRDALLKAIG
jgi:glutaredoxin